MKNIKPIAGFLNENDGAISLQVTATFHDRDDAENFAETHHGKANG